MFGSAALLSNVMPMSTTTASMSSRARMPTVAGSMSRLSNTNHNSNIDLFDDCSVGAGYGGGHIE
jgi:hypothetical protein